MPRIEYESLDFKNAYIYRRCSIPLSNQGLVLVRGLNLDDGGYLGSGKSSLFEVFAQLQMGKGGKRDYRRGQHRQDMINSFVGSNLEASLKLLVDGHPYEVRQYRAHDRYGNAIYIIDRDTGQNIVPKEVAASPFKWFRDTIMGVDETTFFNLVYLAQESTNVMLHGTESARRQQLTSMFGLDVYDDLYAATRRYLDLHSTAMSDLDNVDAEVKEIKARLSSMPAEPSLVERLDAATMSLKELELSVKTDMDEFSELSKLHSGLVRRHDLVVEIKVIFSNAKFPDIIKNPNDITSEYVAEQKASYENTYAAYVMAKSALDSVQKRASLVLQLSKTTSRDPEIINSELIEAKTTLRRLQNTDLPQAEQRVELLSALQKLGVPKDTLDDLDKQHSDAVLEETSLKNSIQSMHSELSSAVCPTCHRPYNISPERVKELQDALVIARDQLERVTNLIHTLKSKRAHCIKYKGLQDQLKSFTVTNTPEEIQSEIRKLTKLEHDLTLELDLARRRADIVSQLAALPDENEEELLDRVKRLKREYETYSSRYESAKSILDKLLQLVKLPKGDLPTLEKTLKNLKTKIDRSSKLLTAASKKVGDLSAELDELRRLLARRDKLLSVLERREHLQHEVLCLQALKKAFDPKGLKQDRFRSILTDATDITVPPYSRVLWQGGNIDLKISERADSIHFDLFRRGSASTVPTNYTLLSGGERHKSGLAFLFGMRDLKERYTNTSFNVMIVDEPFGGLDPQGTENLISVFEMLKHRFGTIFVVSHRPEVLENTVWDQTWWAIREGNNSTLYTDNVPERYLNIARSLVKQ